MILVISGRHRRKHKSLFEQMFALRRSVFIGMRNWSLPESLGLERDQYDDDHAIYFIHLDREGAIDSHVRLNPTVHSSLTADLFPHLIENGLSARGPRIFEATRFIVLPKQRERSELKGLKARLIAATVDWGIHNGVSHLQTVIDAGTLSSYVEMSTLVTPLGLAHPYGGGKSVPGGGECLVFRLPLNVRLLDDLRSYGQIAADEELWSFSTKQAA